MKAITLWEPWGTLVAYGYKEVETRDWYTGYRGPLAIHAAVKRANPKDVSHATFALGAHGLELPPLTFGAVVATCHLVACLPAALAILKARQLKPAFEPRRGWAFETQFGDYEAGRWAWILRDVVRLEKPIAAAGMQKLWELPVEIKEKLPL